MPNKEFTARIKQKRDTSANWESRNPVILNGEIILVDTNAGELRAKIGDGTKTYTQLPFSDEALRSLINANKLTVDDTLSSTSTNPVQNKVVNTAISNLSTLVGDESVAAQIASAIADKVDIANGQYAVTASSSDGVAYTATVPGIIALTSGVSFIMIPGKASASTTPTLNVNGLGAKNIKRRLSNLATGVQAGYSASWLAANMPFRVIYDGTQWIVEGQAKPAGADVYGAVAKAKADEDGNVITDTYATIAALQALLPKVTSITLGTSWSGNASPYYQDVALSCCTATSVVDIQPTYTQLADWQDDGLAFTTLSSDGSVRVYVAGGMPTETITVQVKVQEVVVV